MGRFVFLVLAFGAFVAMMAPSKRETDGPAANYADGPRVVMLDASKTSDTDTLEPSAWGETVIQRGYGGQFHLDVAVNSQNLPFLIDTGADTVALTINDARRIGIYVNPYEFEPVGTGAGGELQGAQVMIDRMTVAGHELHNVPAIVIDGLETNLLGQSVLRRFGKVELAGDRMTIR